MEMEVAYGSLIDTMMRKVRFAQKPGLKAAMGKG
jgi:hypothetical protein